MKPPSASLRRQALQVDTRIRDSRSCHTCLLPVGGMVLTYLENQRFVEIKDGIIPSVPFTMTVSSFRRFNLLTHQ